MVDSSRGITLKAGDCFWSPVHEQALYAVRLTQTALYVVALPDQPERAATKGKCPPGDPRPRAASKFLSGDTWSWDELTPANQHFVETFETLTRPVASGGVTQRMPGEPGLAPEEIDMAKRAAKAKAAKTPREKKAPREKKGPRKFWLTAKEAKPEDFEKGGGLYGNAGEVYKAAKAACGATADGTASSEAIAHRLEKREGNESKTDPLILTRAYLSKVVAAGFMKAEERGAKA